MVLAACTLFRPSTYICLNIQYYIGHFQLASASSVMSRSTTVIITIERFSLDCLKGLVLVLVLVLLRPLVGQCIYFGFGFTTVK